MRYFIISLLIHLMFLVFTFKQPEKPTKVDVTVRGGQGSQNQDELNSTTVDIIPKDEGGSDKKPVGFYYGLGIVGEYRSFQDGSVGYLINEVVTGYNGEAAGLQVGDVILLVNGENPMMNDISGSEPKALTLNVLRGKVILVILTERGKVLY
jgi:hypothetical protein